MVLPEESSTVTVSCVVWPFVSERGEGVIVIVAGELLEPQPAAARASTPTKAADNQIEIAECRMNPPRAAF